jgi:hypothetical protein
MFLSSCDYLHKKKLETWAVGALIGWFLYSAPSVGVLVIGKRALVVVHLLSDIH